MYISILYVMRITQNKNVPGKKNTLVNDVDTKMIANKF